MSTTWLRPPLLGIFLLLVGCIAPDIKPLGDGGTIAPTNTGLFQTTYGEGDPWAYRVMGLGGVVALYILMYMGYSLVLAVVEKLHSSHPKENHVEEERPIIGET